MLHICSFLKPQPGYDVGDPVFDSLPWQQRVSAWVRDKFAAPLREKGVEAGRPARSPCGSR